MAEEARDLRNDDLVQLRMADDELWELVSNAKCLLWRSEVFERDDGHMVWDIEFPDDDVAQSFLPLVVDDGQSWSEAWASLRLPEDKVRADQLAADALRGGKTHYQQEFRYCCADGSIRWLFEEVTVKRLDDHRWQCVGICTDITERKRAQEEASYLVASARCLMWRAMVEDQGCRIHWELTVPNERAAQELLPLNLKPGQTWQQAWYDRRSPEERDETNRVATEALRSGKRSYSNEFKQINKYGKEQWLLEDVRIEPLGPNRWHCVGVCVDITERKKAEAERLRLHHKLDTAIQQVNELSELLPLCASCKKVRNDEGYWHQIESYIKERVDVKISHGICPECMTKLYPQFGSTDG